MFRYVWCMNLSLHHIRIVHSGLRTYVRTYVCVYEHRIKLLSNANIHMAVLSTKYVNTHVSTRIQHTIYPLWKLRCASHKPSLSDWVDDTFVCPLCNTSRGQLQRRRHHQAARFSVTTTDCRCRQAVRTMTCDKTFYKKPNVRIDSLTPMRAQVGWTHPSEDSDW